MLKKIVLAVAVLAATNATAEHHCGDLSVGDITRNCVAPANINVPSDTFGVQLVGYRWGSRSDYRLKSI